MKTNHPSFTMNLVRVAACLAAALCLASISARAAGSATIDLAGATFGNGLDVHLDSGTTLITPATSYNFTLTGTVHFTGFLSFVYPDPIDLAMLVDQLQPGASSVFSGTKENPNGTLPLRIIRQSVSGTAPITGGQVLTFSAKIVGKITAEGLVRFDLTKVNLSVSDFFLPLGTVVFDSGSLVVNAPPVITLKSELIKVSEGVGTFQVVVKRKVNSVGTVSVHYASSSGTAEDIDYTPVSGDLTFADGETSKTFDVNIVHRDGNQGNRTFRLKLSDPMGGALLGARTKAVVKIIDDSDQPPPGSGIELE